MRAARVASVLLPLLLAAPHAGAEAWQLSLDPAATRIAFTLPARLHTVRGTFALERGELRFDPDTGEASGEIVVDATSGDTGIDARDRVMHEQVLASAEHREMVLRLLRLEVGERGADRLAGVAHGVFRVRGGEHPVAVRFEGTRSGERARLTARFDVPWVAWGLPDPSTFLLSVDKTLAVEVTSSGRLEPR